MKTLFALAAWSLAALPAFAEPPANIAAPAPAAGVPAATPAATAPAAPDPNKKICKTKNKTGSRFPERTCLTKAEWERLRMEAQDTVSNVQIRAYQGNGGGSGG
jgi:hypothetical protein